MKNTCPTCSQKLENGPFWNGSYKGMGIYHYKCRPEEADQKLNPVEMFEINMNNTTEIAKTMLGINKEER